MAKRTTDPVELKRRKAQKRLEALDYTPHIARYLSRVLRRIAVGLSGVKPRAEVSSIMKTDPIASGVLDALKQNPPRQREARKRAFTDIANER